MGETGGSGGRWGGEEGEGKGSGEWDAVRGGGEKGEGGEAGKGRGGFEGTAGERGEEKTSGTISQPCSCKPAAVNVFISPPVLCYHVRGRPCHTGPHRGNSVESVTTLLTPALSALEIPPPDATSHCRHARLDVHIHNSHLP